jgi:hypothetical protein
MYLPLKFKPSKLEVIRLVKISKNETKMLQKKTEEIAENQKEGNQSL